MAKNPWFPMYPGDYLADTQSLSTRQHGAYCLLMFTYYIVEEPLPDDDTEMARITRLGLRTWVQERPRLERFFTIRDGFWIHKRIDKELLRRSDLSTAARKKAELRWKRAVISEGLSKVIPDAAASLQHMPVACHSQPQSQPQPQSEAHASDLRAGKRLHGIPGSVEEVIEFGKGCMPRPVPEDRCRAFWAHYEGQARTTPNGDVFWITSNPSGEIVVTNWKVKLPQFGLKDHENNRTSHKPNPRNAGAYGEPSEQGKRIADTIARKAKERAGSA
jgi:uncharacterized protein YdaU (DUF1376 family)